MAGDLTVRNIKVTDRIEPGSAGGTVTLGNSINADTIAVPSGVTLNINSGATFSATAGTMSGQNYPAFEATLSANQSIPNTTATKVQFNTENYDTNGYYDNATNYRFTPLVAGKYFVYSYVRFLSIVDGNQGIVYLYKNGSSISFTNNGSAGGTNAVNFSTIITQIIDLNGSTDYIEAFVYQDSGSSKNIQGGSGGGFTTTFGAYRIGS